MICWPISNLKWYQHLSTVTSAGHNAALIGSDGQVYTSSKTGVYDAGGKTMYSWPSLGAEPMSASDWIIGSHDDWFYLAKSGWTDKVFLGADGTFWGRCYAYSPVRHRLSLGTYTASLSSFDYTIGSWATPVYGYGASQVSIDPYSGIGVIMNVFRLDRPVGDYSQVKGATFTAGSRTTIPTSGTTFLDRTNPSDGVHIIPVGASAWNSTGLVYYSEGGNYYFRTIANLNSPSLSTVRSGYQMIAALGGPHLFVDDSDTDVIRQYNGSLLSWNLAVTTSPTPYILYLGDDDTYYYVSYSNSTFTGYIYALNKAGTTFTLLQTDQGIGCYQNSVSYSGSKIRGANYFTNRPLDRIPSVQMVSDGAGNMKQLVIPIRECT